MTISQNISQAWISADYESKQHLQKLVFPEGMVYDKQKGVVRTLRVNSLFGAIPLLARVSEEKEKGESSQNRLQSNQVPTKGIEPSHPCEWQILSLLRLPIPPHGQLKCSLFKRFNKFKMLVPHFKPDF